MRALTTTSSVLRVVCDTNADLDCHASSVDLTLSTGDVAEVISTSTVITTAGTTTIVAAPAATERRNVKALSIANVDASLGGNVTVEHYNGTDAITIWKGYMNPGDIVQMGEDGRFEFLGVAVARDVQIFTTVGANTWTKPTSFTARIVVVRCIGGGGEAAAALADRRGRAHGRVRRRRRRVRRQDP